MVGPNSTKLSRRKFLSYTMSAVGVPRLPSTSTGQLSVRRRWRSDLPHLSFPSSTLSESFISTYSRVRYFDPNPAYASLDVETAAERLLKLDPDNLMSNVPTDYNDEVPDLEMTVWKTAWGIETRALQFEMGRPHGIHLGYDYGADDRTWYETLPSDEKFRWPDGSPVEDLYDLAALTLTGTKHGDPDEWISPSPFAPATIELLVRTASTFLSEGLSLVNFDATNYPRLWGLDFSRWATAAFRVFLGDQSSEQLDTWGIDDTTTFDIRAYINSSSFGPGGDESPATDPVVREFTIEHHRAIKALWHTVNERTKSQEYPAGEIGTTPNADPTWNSPVCGIYLHDAFDIVGFEEKVPTVPPESIRDSLYKLMLAAGRFSKLPVDHEAALPPSDVDNLGFDLDVRYTTLMRLQLAEAYATGGRLALNLFVTAGGREVWENPELQPIRWVNSDGTIPEELPPFIDFCLAHRRFIEDVSPANRIAVVYSLPTMLWNTYPQWDLHPDSYLDSFEGACSLLRKNEFPYDVIIFGHPRLWDDPPQRERLAEYSTVVLPNMDAISDDQVHTLENILDEGVNILVSGTPAGRSAMYKPRDDVRMLLESHDNATILDDDPGRRHTKGVDSGDSFVKELNRTTKRQIDLSTNAQIGVNTMVQSEPARYIIHLVNYEYDIETDETQTFEDVAVTIQGPPIQGGKARWYAPSGVKDLAMEQDPNGIRVTVPRLDIWGFIAIAADETALHPGDEKAATSAVEAAKQSVRTAKDEGRTRELHLAEHRLSNAQAMLEYDAFNEAHDWANRAVKQANLAYAQPTIGVDVGHGQSESGTGYEKFAPIRERFDDYRYRQVEDYTDDELGQLDLLIVPPAYLWKDASYGFGSGEIDQLEQFVSAGGSLLVLGRARVANDINDLLSTFDLAVDERFVAGDDPEAETTLSPLTRDLDRIVANYVRPVAEPPEDALVLSSFPEDTEAWYHSEPPDNERSANEPSAAGAPVYVLRNWDAGLVAYLGTVDPYLWDPGQYNTRRGSLAKHSLSVLGSHARRTKGISKSLTETPSTTSPTTSSGQGGLTLLTGLLGGLIGTLLYWRWRTNTDEDN